MTAGWRAPASPPRIRRQISVPGMSGSIRSSSTTSGAKLCTAASPFAPFSVGLHLEARRGQVVGQQLAQIGLVLDDQHAPVKVVCFCGYHLGRSVDACGDGLVTDEKKAGKLPGPRRGGPGAGFRRSRRGLVARPSHRRACSAGYTRRRNAAHRSRRPRGERRVPCGHRGNRTNGGGLSAVAAELWIGALQRMPLRAGRRRSHHDLRARCDRQRAVDVRRERRVPARQGVAACRGWPLGADLRGAFVANGVQDSKRRRRRGVPHAGRRRGARRHSARVLGDGDGRLPGPDSRQRRASFPTTVFSRTPRPASSRANTS